MLKLRPDTKSGGGGGVAVGFWPDTKSGGGGGGVLSVSSPIRKADGGGGGGAIGLWPYTGAYPECAEKLARTKFLATTPILETEGGARAP